MRGKLILGIKDGLTKALILGATAARVEALKIVSTLRQGRFQVEKLKSVSPSSHSNRRQASSELPDDANYKITGTG